MNTSVTQADNSADAEIATAITDILDKRGMSVSALSELTGIPYPTLRRSLKSGRSLTFAEFHRIAAALEVQPSTLLPGTLVAA